MMTAIPENVGDYGPDGEPTLADSQKLADSLADGMYAAGGQSLVDNVPWGALRWIRR